MIYACEYTLGNYHMKYQIKVSKICTNEKIFIHVDLINPSLKMY